MQDKLEALRRKYRLLGQDMEAYLEGLLYSRSLTYWDYIELDTLLTLQKPRTDFPDEIIFIIYHQITELYFKLVKAELELLLQESWQEEAPLLKRLSRVASYFRHLTHSFEIMMYGMDSANFLRFRTALLPASGFQSVQFREIELYLTGLRQLLAPHKRDLTGEDLRELYENIYWKFGNLDARTGEKTLTLRLFEQKYDTHLFELARRLHGRNVNARLEEMLSRGHTTEKLIRLCREVDVQINLHWRLVHLRTAAHYLKREEGSLPSTGGTNWQKYLPPYNQGIQFFPSLWSEEEKAEWGRGSFLERYEREVESYWRMSSATA
ncbi:MAG: tryptophan 2,3-dioxygenase family protein [Bacteroidia bacterium]|nr:tryptophan 2,3-dioxygenase family protein [Bacteroidia bacterium]MCX7764448.1 tryptophan 2,3-dioxygenase family protein [Bacteroidia bacterium]MDW8057311.1 tryptophan 2,3-dioxygenase family protein [Bacteroidia bacterium]